MKKICEYKGFVKLNKNLTMEFDYFLFSFF